MLLSRTEQNDTPLSKSSSLININAEYFELFLWFVIS